MDDDLIELGGTKYIAGTTPVGALSYSTNFQSEESPTRIPITIINAVSDEASFGPWIKSRLEELNVMDDAISAPFTEHVIIKTFGNEPEYFTMEAVFDGYWLDSSDEIPCDGPYFLEGRTLYKAYRLYEDEYNAFVCGVVQSEKEPFRDKKYIPVPSRCYSQVLNEQKPLSGKRIAVKDIYDLRGLPTSAGCKAYGAHHGPSKDTAECIKVLLDQGAVIVAKAKTVQFASGMASADWTADKCPTNPRGDGQLDTGCSSAGSAAAIAGYEWLDTTIGSDSLGSMTGPAAACGVFGLRPSLGTLSNVGAVPVSERLIMAVTWTRLAILAVRSQSFRKWEALGSGLWRLPVSIVKKPVTILVPRESQVSYNDTNISAWKDFLQDLEAYCGVSQTSTVAHIQLHDCWKNASQFLEAYSEDAFGKLEIDPLIRYKWYALAFPLKAPKLIKVFRSFLERKIFTERTIMVLPGGAPDVRFRDEKTSEDQYNMWQGFGLQNTTYSVLGGLPAVNIPGPYHSKLSGDVAQQPVSVMVLGSRGSDIWLIQHLEKALREDRRHVHVGSDTF
ncbi:amidase signature enzyme [Mollisia scopiformis]|uniref:Amidase signature enzyme n=1 Tax=Mollisia scopiformis TaxID=149040 RepID=A0A194XT37_MOLSC|nr:amidase signature enzyme [Mollisia scopiformis]KUJ23209.1 amidase signature enzyme [Mollisia scopiformis]